MNLTENDLGIILPINDIQKGKKFLINLLRSIENNQFNTEVDKEVLKEFTWDAKADKFKLAIQDYL